MQENTASMDSLRFLFLHRPWALFLPLLLFSATILGGVLLRRVLFSTISKWARRTDSHLDTFIVEGLNGPILIWAVILGLHVALQNSEIPDRYLRNVPRTLEVLWLVSLMIAASHLAGNVVRFYGGRVTGSQSVTSLTQKLAQLVVVALGVVWILKVVFDFSLTPVLTTLGVGGLAVALALQDTLSNLFAGFYTSMSGLVRIGDYIKLNTGEEGYVVDIAWRSTTIRSLSESLVVIPNAKLGQAIFTNYSLPEPSMRISVSFSTGYDMDVERVERILLEEAIAGAKEIPGMIADSKPSVLFSPGPGDFALGFQVNVHVNEFSKQFRVQSDLRKRIFRRFLAENISMPYPTQSVLLENKNQQ